LRRTGEATSELSVVVRLDTRPASTSSPQQERYLPPLALAGKRQRPLGLL